MPSGRGTRRQTAPTGGRVTARRREADASRTVRRNGVAGAARTQRRGQTASLRQTPVPQPASSRPRRSAVGMLARIMDVIIAALALAVVVCLAIVILRGTGAFTIQTLEAPATEHLSGDDIARLANVGQGTTLLTVDVDAIREGLESDPWVKDVEVERVFPSTLRVTVTERSVTELVLMSSGQIAWYVGDGDVWIEPVSVSTSAGQTAAEAALNIALGMGTLLVTDVPASVAPEAGAVVTDEPIMAVDEYLDELPDELASQIVSFSAPSADAISCVLESGIEVSLGSPTDIASKGAIVLKLLEEHPGEITYINVRSTSDPSYRGLSSGSVQSGSGLVASTDDADSTSSDESSDASVDDSQE